MVMIQFGLLKKTSLQELKRIWHLVTPMMIAVIVISVFCVIGFALLNTSHHGYIKSFSLHVVKNQIGLTNLLQNYGL